MPELNKIISKTVLNENVIADSFLEIIKNPAEEKPENNILDDIKKNYTCENELCDFIGGEEDEIEIDDDKKDVNNCSAVFPIAIIPGAIIDLIDGDSKDGEIGDTKQHATGDCWLLSAVNALSYTEEGRQIIKDSLEYHEDYTIVHLPGIGDIRVDNYEVATTKGSKQYSSGDDDMIIFELAVEKVLDSIANGDIKLDMPLNSNANNRERTAIGESSTGGGFSRDALYYLTGIKGSYTYNKDEKAELLDEFEQRESKNLVLACGLNSSVTMNDVNGNEVNLPGHHEYAIKSVDGNTVTIINPWDSSKEIVLSKDEFLEIADCWIDYCDLNQEPENLIMTPTVDEEGNKVYERDCKPSEAKGFAGDKNKCVREVTKYSEDGTLLEAKYLDEDGNVVYERQYDEEGNVTKEWSFNSANNVGLSVEYDEEGNVKDVKIYNTYEGNIEDDKNWKMMLYNDDYKQLIFDRNLFDYPQFLANDIIELMYYSEEDWAVAEKILKNNPNASMSEIKQAIEDKKTLLNGLKDKMSELKPDENNSKEIDDAFKNLK